MSEDVERVTVRREVGTPDRSGGYTIIGLILGVLLVVGVAVAVIGGPEIQRWWNTDAHGHADNGPNSTSTITTP